MRFILDVLEINPCKEYVGNSHFWFLSIFPFWKCYGNQWQSGKNFDLLQEAKNKVKSTHKKTKQNECNSTWWVEYDDESKWIFAKIVQICGSIRRENLTVREFLPTGGDTSDKVTYILNSCWWRWRRRSMICFLISRFI